MAEEELPTVVDGPRRSATGQSSASYRVPGAPPSGAGTGGSTGVGLDTAGANASTTLGTPQSLGAFPHSTLDLPKPETVLRRAAFEQTRRMGITGLLFNGLGLAVGPFVGGDATARKLFLAAMALGVVYNGWLIRVCTSESTYRQRQAIAYFSIAPFTNTAVLYHLGTFGPVLCMFVLNVYTACIAYNRRVAQVTLIGSIAPFAILGTLMAVGVLRDPGLITITSGVGLLGRVVIVISFTLFLYLTYEQARHTRENMVASLVARDAAVRLASHREALVLEARQDLERALSAGGLGRFSDRTLGSFKLGPVLGRGGMGEVYQATHVTSGEPAAVKMLLPEVLGRIEYVRRFLREVRIAASVDSPHVVRVLEVGDESAPMPYLAMELLTGEDLAQLLRREGRLSGEDVVELLRQVGRGLTAASALGIVHRDLKPQNLFRSEGDPPVWKILDFGVSKLMDSEAGITRGEAIGTPRYMSPEQARGADVDARSDLYSLSVIAYRALTGHPPFKGDDVPVLVQIMTRMPACPSTLARLHPHVDCFFAVGLAKDPRDRFQTADDLVRALEAALAGKLRRKYRERAAALLADTPWHDAG